MSEWPLDQVIIETTAVNGRKSERKTTAAFISLCNNFQLINLEPYIDHASYYIYRDNKWPMGSEIYVGISINLV